MGLAFGGRDLARLKQRLEAAQILAQEEVCLPSDETGSSTAQGAVGNRVA